MLSWDDITFKYPNSSSSDKEEKCHQFTQTSDDSYLFIKLPWNFSSFHNYVCAMQLHFVPKSGSIIFIRAGTNGH